MNSLSFESNISNKPEKGFPINIPIKSKNNDSYQEEYSLNSNIFDPSNFSPHSQWKQRLEMRIKSYESLNTLETQKNK